MSETPIETGVEEVQATPRRIGHRAFDIILSLSAISISVISLVVAIEHGKTQHDLLAASNWPFMGAVVEDGSDDTHMIRIGAVNAGVGPAKVKTFEMSYRGQPVSSGIDLLRKCCGLGGDAATIKAQLPNGLSYSLIGESVMRAGDTTPVLSLKRSGDQPVTEKLAQSLHDISFRVCYCSILDQCWVGDLWTTQTRPVERCAPPAHPFDPNGR